MGCKKKLCRAELKEVPPNDGGGGTSFEMPTAATRGGTASVPPYGATRCFCRLAPPHEWHTGGAGALGYFRMLVGNVEIADHWQPVRPQRDRGVLPHVARAVDGGQDARPGARRIDALGHFQVAVGAVVIAIDPAT